MRRSISFAACVVLAAGSVMGAEPVATFSIVAYDSVTGDLGIAVQSKFFAVGAIVPCARAGVGAIASQAFANPSFGPRGLDMLASGEPVERVLELLLADDAHREQRQLGIVGRAGRSAAFTGARCLPWAGHMVGKGYAAQGNVLVSEETVAAMAGAFESTDDLLGERLMRALEAGQQAGGDSRGMQSAAMLIVRSGGGYGGYDDRYCDLRVDDHTDPIGELRRIFDLWKVQALITAGYARADAGDTEGAISLGRRAILADSVSGEPHYHLACYFSKALMRDEALTALEQAIHRDSTLERRASEDPDFAPLLSDPRFIALTVRP